MNENDKPVGSSLTSAGRHELTASTSANPLVSRGLAAIAVAEVAVEPIAANAPKRSQKSIEFSASLHSIGLQLQRQYIHLYGVPHPRLPQLPDESP